MSSIPCSVQGTDRGSERKRLIAWREALSAAERSVAESAIGNRVLTLLSSLQPGVVALYWPIRGEPQLAGVMPALAQAGFGFALPRVRERGEPLEFGRWVPGAPLVPAEFGVMLAQPFHPVAPHYIVLPCVGFSQAGYRLGYGAGYYDRTLAAHPVLAIGVAFDGSELAGFVPQPHDRRLDYLITETRSLDCRSSRAA